MGLFYNGAIWEENEAILQLSNMGLWLGTFFLEDVRKVLVEVSMRTSKTATPVARASRPVQFDNKEENTNKNVFFLMTEREWVYKRIEIACKKTRNRERERE